MQKIHHANIIVGKEDHKDFVFKILKKDLDFEIKANPDFLFLEKESFGISDARELEKWAIGKPLIGNIKVSFIIINSITHEAQNALLKLLEEPTPGTYFFIKLENLGGILPTFLSRARVLNVLDKSAEKNIGMSDSLKFMRSSIKEKFALIRSLSKEEDKTNIKNLIKNLDKIAYINNSKNIKKILTAKIFASARGSSPRMLLEWLTCVI